MFNIRSITFLIFSITICSHVQAMDAAGKALWTAEIKENRQTLSIPWLSKNFDLDTFFDLRLPDPNNIILDTGQTVLSFACEQNRKDIVAKLLRYTNLKVNAQDHKGNTALHYACYNENEEIVALLMRVQQIDHEIKNNEKISPLDLAIKGMQSVDQEKGRKSAIMWRLFTKRSRSML